MVLYTPKVSSNSITQFGKNSVSAQFVLNFKCFSLFILSSAVVKDYTLIITLTNTHTLTLVYHIFNPKHKHRQFFLRRVHFLFAFTFVLPDIKHKDLFYLVHSAHSVSVSYICPVLSAIL